MNIRNTIGKYPTTFALGGIGTVIYSSGLMNYGIEQIRDNVLHYSHHLYPQYHDIESLAFGGVAFGGVAFGGLTAVGLVSDFTIRRVQRKKAKKFKSLA